MKIEWDIINFTHLYSEDDSLKLSFVQSDDFLCENNEKFFLRMYPKNYDEECREYVSISLHPHERANLNASCKVKVFNGYKEANEGVNPIVNEDEILFKQFIHTDLVTDCRNGYYPEDILTIHCEIKIPGTRKKKNLKLATKVRLEVERLPWPHKWSIENFRNLAPRTEVFASNDYYFPNNADKVFLRLWPNNPDHNNENHISIYWYLITRRQKKYVQYKMSLTDCNGQPVHSKTNRHNLTKNLYEFGHNRYVALDQVLHKDARLLDQNSHLKMNWMVEVIGNEIRSRRINSGKRLKRVARSANETTNMNHSKFSGCVVNIKGNLKSRNIKTKVTKKKGKRKASS